MFDLGVTYQLQKNNPTRKFILENSVEFDKDNFIDQKIIELLKLSEKSINK